MQFYQAEISIGGLITNTVVKTDLSAAEIVILRNIHGDDAVRAIKIQGEHNRPYQVEYDRLLNRYGRKKLEKAFPGSRPVLPQKLIDIGIVVRKDGRTLDEVLAKGPNNDKVKTKREKELAEMGMETEDKDDPLGLEDED